MSGRGKAKRKLSYTDVIFVRYDIANGARLVDVAEKHKVSISCISNVAAGKTYKDVAGPLTKGGAGRSGRKPRGVEKISRVERRKRNSLIARDYKRGKKVEKLCSKYGLTRPRVYQILKDKGCGRYSQSQA